MSNERQINYVNEIQNRVQNLYYVDDASELNGIDLKENDKIYAINDNKLFQMEIVDQEEELSGSIVSFNGRNNTKIKSVVANIEPVQDLHGYSNPWPAGGGNNLFDINSVSKSVGTNCIVSGDQATITIDGSAMYQGITFGGPTNLVFPVGTYYIKANVVSLDVTTYTRIGFRNSSSILINITPLTLGQMAFSVTISEPAFFSILLNGGSDNKYSNTAIIKDIIVSATDTDYEPYSNICPISGQTGANITGTGINIWDEEWENGYWDTTTGEPVTANNYMRCKNFIRVSPNTVYRMSVGKTDTQQNQAIWFDESYNVVGSPTFQPNATITSPANAKYLKFYMNWHYGNVYSNDISINYPSTYTGYYPHGTTLPINWQTEAGTIYGGTVTLNEDGSADLVATHAKWIEDGSRQPAYPNWKTGNTGISACLFGSIPNPQANHNVVGNNGFICDSRKYGSENTTFLVTNWGFAAYTATNFSFAYSIPDTCTTKEEVAQYFSENPVEVVYPLLTPQTYHFDNIGQLTAFLGTNNIWSDINDVTVKIAEKGITAFELEPHF